MQSCVNYTTLDEFWQDAIGARIRDGGLKVLCRDAFAAGVFAALWLRDRDIDPFEELQKMILEQSQTHGRS